jgi:hypothetical protein
MDYYSPTWCAAACRLDQAYVSELIFVVACALLGCVYAAVVYCFVNDYELRHDN